MDPLGSLVSRVRAMNPYRVDALIAALFLVDGAIELAVNDGPGADRVVALGAMVVIAGAVAIRRRAPVGGMVLAVAALIALGRLDKAVADGMAGPFFAVLLSVYSVGAHTEGRRFTVGAALAVILAVVSAATDQYHTSASEIFFTLALFVAAPLFGGQLLRSRSRLNRALREKAELLDRERGDRAEQAALEERTRIAGELHDVVSHALGAMTVQAAAARRLGASDRERARAAFAAVEETGREALGELRRLLGVLRREDEDLGLAPQPTLAHVSSLIGRTRAAGLPVALRVDGEPAAPLSAGVDLTAYRVVQAALAEALASGGAGRAEVLIRYGPDAVEVVVTDDGMDGSRRLLGMRERVGLYGGELHAGRRRDGGHRVRARLPVEVLA